MNSISAVIQIVNSWCCLVASLFSKKVLQNPNKIYQIGIAILFLFPTHGYCQSVIKGNVYFYDTQEPATGCLIIVTDSIKTDTITSKNLKGTIADAFGDLNGNFEIKNFGESSNDLLISLVGYRNTIVKNIRLNNDTIQLKDIPLFLDDNVIHISLVLNKRQRLFSRFRKKYWNDQSIIGTEGLFTYHDELMINCRNNSGKKICCKRKRAGIEIDNNELKTCGNKRE